MLVFAAVVLAVRLTGADTALATRAPGILLVKALLVVGLFQACLYFSDLYTFPVAANAWEVRLRLVQALGAASVLLGGFALLVPSVLIAPNVYPLTVGLTIGFVVLWRAVFAWWASWRRFDRRLLVVGAGARGRELLDQLAAHPALGYTVCGFVDEDLTRDGGWLAGLPILGTPDDLERVVRRERAATVVVALDERRGHFPLHPLLLCRAHGTDVEDVHAFLERITGKVALRHLRPSALVYGDGFRVRGWSLWIKRCVDATIALAGLLLAAPLMAVTALAILLDSPGPIFFAQERVGQYDRPFTLRKFRSMRVDAEEESGPVWAERHDPRVTRVGRIIRLTRIDELPQMLNVLLGHMSFVGPRPERPYFVEQLEKEIPFYFLRHVVKPGITGWAQIRYPYGASVHDAWEKLHYELYYIKHRSLALDALILWDTIAVILFGRGGR